KAGVVLVRWLAFEIPRIYLTLVETTEQRQTRRLLELLLSWGGSTTARRLQKANSSRYKSAEDAEAALQKLVEGGLADWHDRTPGPAGGRPTRVCTLKPEKTQPKTDTTPDDEDDDDDGLGDRVPTQPPDTTPPGSENPRVSEGC